MFKSKFFITIFLVIIQKPVKYRNMKIPSAHLQMVSNQCTDFHKNSCTHLLESCPQTGDRQTNRQTDRSKDGQTDRWTDGWMDGWMDGWTDGQTDIQGEKNIPPKFICGRYK